MRIGLLVALFFLTACASEKLALVPPPGVDFTGRWVLNEADSDDPLRLVQSQNAAAASGSPTGQGGQGGQGGHGGRGGGRGSRGGGDFGGVGPGTPGPSMPAVTALSEGLHWPGRDVEVKQVAGVLTITSAGRSQVCHPSAEGKSHPHRHSAAAAQRDMPARGRGDGPPPSCGWDDKTLVVQSRDSDDEGPPFIKRYSLSDDGQRLIEVVGFKGGRSNGFSM